MLPKYSIHFYQLQSNILHSSPKSFITCSPNLTQYLLKIFWCQSKAKRPVHFLFRPCSFAFTCNQALFIGIHMQSGLAYVFSQTITFNHLHSHAITFNHLGSLAITFNHLHSLAFTCFLCPSLTEFSSKVKTSQGTLPYLRCTLPYQHHTIPNSPFVVINGSLQFVYNENSMTIVPSCVLCARCNWASIAF